MVVPEQGTYTPHTIGDTYRSKVSPETLTFESVPRLPTKIDPHESRTIRYTFVSSRVTFGNEADTA